MIINPSAYPLCTLLLACSPTLAAQNAPFSTEEQEAIRKITILVRLMVYEPEFVEAGMQDQLEKQYISTIAQLPPMHQLYFEGLRDLVTEMNKQLSHVSDQGAGARREIVEDYRDRLNQHSQVYNYELSRPEGYYEQRRELKELLAYTRPSASVTQQKQANIALMLDLLASLSTVEKPQVTQQAKKESKIAEKAQKPTGAEKNLTKNSTKKTSTSSS